MCNGCGSCAGSVAYIAEKLVSFAAMTAVICCIVLTVTISIGLGVGLGYNYCFVDLKIITEEPEEEPYGLLMRTGEAFTEMPSYRRSMAPSTHPRRMLPIPAIKHTMAIPLNEDFDFSSLLSKLRSRNRNVTIELITLSLWLTCTSLICCLVITLTVTLGMGIGVGYNYGFVQMSRKPIRTYVAGHWKYPGDPCWRPSSNDQTPSTEVTPIGEENLPGDNFYSTENENSTLNFDSESSYGTDFSVESTDDVPPNEESAEISNNSLDTAKKQELMPELNNTASSISESTNTTFTDSTPDTANTNITVSTSKDTEIVNVTYEPPPETIDEPTPPMNIDPNSRRVTKLVIPISGIDLISLLSKISAENKNYTLQIVTT